MRHFKNPRQRPLFDPYQNVFSDKARAQLLGDWHGVFRHVILELMPVDVLAGAFHPEMGRPTKELYSMAALVFIMEYQDWTLEQATEAYRYNMALHFALNLEPIAHDIAQRTIERYKALFIKNDLAAHIQSVVTDKLCQELDIRVDRQRLDSTHVFSNMAIFGRTRLMGIAVKRFLTQVKRHDPAAYDQLDASLRERYAQSEKRLFGDTKKDETARRLLRQQIAENMYFLINHFSDKKVHANRNTYKTLEQIFHEQCQVKEEKVTIKAKPGGHTLQNPSDPDATYSHKGPGYQVQIAETCHPDNEVQIITHGGPQTAVESDAEALQPAIDELIKSNRKPNEFYTDTLYGSDDNFNKASQKGVELISPTPSGSMSEADKNDDRLTWADFDVDLETYQVTHCPAGHVPEFSRYIPSSDTVSVKMGGACVGCELKGRCSSRCTISGYYILSNGKAVRLAQRRRYEQSDAFKERYRIRGGIEGLNGCLKQKMGFGRLRVRGKASVFHSLQLKIAGWNILRAACSTRMQQTVAELAL